jgi:exopolysaccharide biosynthesis protein
MLKNCTILSILLFIGSTSLAQNTDSVEVVNAKWNTQTISKNVKLLTHNFSDKNLFNSNQNISIIEIGNNGKKAVFSLGVEPQKLVKTSEYGQREKNAIAAINGNFFDMKNGGSVDFVKQDGQVIHINKLGAKGNRGMHQKAAVVINKGMLSIKKWDGTDDWEKSLTEENILNSGPLLTYNSVDEKLADDAFHKNRHPRSCVGIKADGKAILVTVDGRNANGEGMSLPELTKVMRWLGCKDILNLDGGGSTALWVNGQNDNGIVNYPSDNKLWDHNGERKVANVILVKKN